LKGAVIEKEELDMGIKVDKAANWKLYTNEAPKGFEMIGVVKRGVAPSLIRIIRKRNEDD
jgi:hypothetical protein